jgi:hypothetical protein
VLVLFGFSQFIPEIWPIVQEDALINQANMIPKEGEHVGEKGRKIRRG